MRILPIEWNAFIQTQEIYFAIVKKSWELQNILRFIQDTSDTVKDKMGIAKAHSGDVLRYIQEDAGVVPKAIIITVAGLGGIVAGYRGKSSVEFTSYHFGHPIPNTHTAMDYFLSGHPFLLNERYFADWICFKCGDVTNGIFFISKKVFVKDNMEQGSCLKHVT